MNAAEPFAQYSPQAVPDGSGAEPGTVPPLAIPRPALLATPEVATKRPALAAFFALFPGMGHVYNGLYLRGLVFFLVIFSLIGVIVRGHGLAGIALAFCWLFNVLDSYRQASLINYGYSQDLGLLDLPQRPMASQVGIVAGGLLVVIGVFALLDKFVTINLDWLFDLWPVALILAGAWLIIGTVRDRRRAAGQEA